MLLPPHPHIQTTADCVQYRANKRIVFVYTESQQHSWITPINQAQHGLWCRSPPKRPAAVEPADWTAHVGAGGCKVAFADLAFADLA